MATLTGQELVKLAVDKLADGSDAELVRKLRLWQVSNAQDIPAQVRRWKKGEHQPNYRVTMRLLEALGMLTDEPRTLTTAPPPADPQESLEEAVEQLRDLVTEGFESVERLLVDVVARLPPPAQEADDG